METIREKENHSLGDLFSELTTEVRTLIRHEVDLATVEVSGKASRWSKDVVKLAIGGVVAYAGFMALLAAAIIALALVIPWWASALCIGFITVVPGVVLLALGLRDMKRTRLVPRNTVEELKEDKEWIKRRIS